MDATQHLEYALPRPFTCAESSGNSQPVVTPACVFVAKPGWHMLLPVWQPCQNRGQQMTFASLFLGMLTKLYSTWPCCITDRANTHAHPSECCGCSSASLCCHMAGSAGVAQHKLWQAAVLLVSIWYQSLTAPCTLQCQAERPARQAGRGRPGARPAGQAGRQAARGREQRHLPAGGPEEAGQARPAVRPLKPYDSNACVCGDSSSASRAAIRKWQWHCGPVPVAPLAPASRVAVRGRAVELWVNPQCPDPVADGWLMLIVCKAIT